MPPALAGSILGAMLGLELGSLEQDASNRFCLDGLSWGPGQEGALAARIRRFEATSLRIGAGPLTMELGRLALHDIEVQVRTEAGPPRVSALDAASAELSGLKVHGPLVIPAPTKAGAHTTHGPLGTPASAATLPGEAGGGPWCLAPLAAAEGAIQAKIVDAHLLFDADVTVPIGHGQIDFNAATVAHVGPDSRMGVSRMGLYVDAPNGRSYLYQFPSTPVGGVDYERRGALLGTMVSDRGKLRLQAFGEGLLRQARLGQAQGQGFTEQARMLFERTAVSGVVQLGDGPIALPGLRAEMAGRAEGRNAVRLRAEAVGRGITLEVPALSLRHATLKLRDRELACDEITAPLLLQLVVEHPHLRFAVEVPNMKIAGLHLRS